MHRSQKARIFQDSSELVGTRGSVFTIRILALLDSSDLVQMTANICNSFSRISCKIYKLRGMSADRKK